MRCFEQLAAKGSGKKRGQMAAYVCHSAVELWKSNSALWRRATSEIPGSKLHTLPRPGKPQGLFDSANTYIFNEPWSQWDCINPLSATRVRLFVSFYYCTPQLSPKAAKPAHSRSTRSSLRARSCGQRQWGNRCAGSEAALEFVLG